MKIIDILSGGFLNSNIQKILTDDQKLYEGLITSYSPNILIFSIKKIDDNCGIDYHNSNPDKMLLMFSTSNISIIKKAIKKIELCGWYTVKALLVDKQKRPITDIKDSNNIDFILSKLSNLNNFYLYIEAKFSFDVTEYISKTHKILYHVTTSKKLNKIMKIGLVPKSGNKIGNHPERIYLATSIEGANFIKTKFIKRSKDEEFVTLEINTDNFKNMLNGKLFVDPQFLGYGVFTLSNIPHNAITISK